jgi:hypothetical protein
LSGLPDDDGVWHCGESRLPGGRWSGEEWAEGWAGALDAGRPPESGGGGGGGGRGGRGGRGSRGAKGEGEGRDEAEESYAGNPEDQPWTPIPRQAKSAERGLIPPQRRLKKTSRSA